MLILQLSNKSPWPPNEGGPIAMNALLTGLQNAGHEVHVITMSTPKFKIENDKIPEDFILKTNFRKADVDNNVKPFKAFLNLFSGKSYNIERFHSKHFISILTENLQKYKYDVVIFESIYVASYLPIIRKYSSACIILRAHNIEHVIWERLSYASKNIFKKSYLKLLARRLLKFEEKITPLVDGIAAISEKDASFFRKYSPLVEVVPFGISPDTYKYEAQSKKPASLCHIGSMNWLPNHEGILWFLNKCWPYIEKKLPGLKIFLAGRNMSSSIKLYESDSIIIQGEVADAAEFIFSHRIMVVPLLSGSGVRVKIIEAMAHGRTVISTSIGAEGIKYKNGHDIIIANTPEEFAEKIEYYANNLDECALIGQNARKLIENEHNINTATESLLKIISRFCI